MFSNVESAYAGWGRASVSGCACGLTVTVVEHASIDDPFLFILFIPVGHEDNKDPDGKPVVVVCNDEEQFYEACKDFIPGHVNKDNVGIHQRIKQLSDGLDNTEMDLTPGLVALLQTELERKLTDDEMSMVLSEIKKGTQFNTAAEMFASAAESIETILTALGLDEQRSELEELLAGVDLGDDENQA